jgi:phage terminase small subunit
MPKQVQRSQGPVKPGTNREATLARHIKFADAYLRLDGNGTQAAIEAGYSAHTARAQAPRLLKDPGVKALIAAARERQQQTTSLSRDLVAESARWAIELDLSVILDADGKYLPVKEWPAEVRKAVQELELDAKGKVVKVKFTSRSTARDQAARMVGAYEKDNRQRADPLAQLVAELQGRRSGVGVVAEPD